MNAILILSLKDASKGFGIVVNQYMIETKLMIYVVMGELLSHTAATAILRDGLSEQNHGFYFASIGWLILN